MYKHYLTHKIYTLLLFLIVITMLTHTFINSLGASSREICLTYRPFGHNLLASIGIVRHGHLYHYVLNVTKIRIRICIVRMSNDVANVTVDVFSTSLIQPINVSTWVLVNLRNSSVVGTNEFFPYIISIEEIRKYGIVIGGYENAYFSIPINESKRIIKALKFEYKCNKVAGFLRFELSFVFGHKNGTVIMFIKRTPVVGNEVDLRALVPPLCLSNPIALSGNNAYKKLVELIERFGYKPYRNPSVWLLLTPCLYRNKSIYRIVENILNEKVYVFKVYELPSVLCIKLMNRTCACSYIVPSSGVFAYDPKTGILIGAYAPFLLASVLPEEALFKKKIWVDIPAQAIVLVNANIASSMSVRIEGFNVAQVALLILVSAIVLIIVVIIHRVRSHE